MPWKVGSAKQHLSEVIACAAREPQIIYNRDRPVAAVIGVDRLEAFMKWQANEARPPHATESNDPGQADCENRNRK